MPINDDATLVVSTGHYYTAPVGTAKPADVLDPDSPWVDVGHTSLEDIFSVSSEGGDATTIGTLQNKALRTKYSARTETIAVKLMQFDEAGLKLFLGSNAVVLADGSIGAPTDPTPTDCAYLSVFEDGENYFDIYAPKTEIYRNDDMSLSDTESLSALPIGVKPLKYSTNDWTYAISPLGGISAQIATAGTPGSFSPVGAMLPANLAALIASDVVASPLTLWTVGQRVVLGDASVAHWNATTWIVGNAPA